MLEDSMIHTGRAVGMCKRRDLHGEEEQSRWYVLNMHKRAAMQWREQPGAAWRRASSEEDFSGTWLLL